MAVPFAPDSKENDENARLAALREYSVLDTVPEPGFDRITQLVARLFDVPIALIGLIDANRQWFKSCYGFGVEEVPRSQTFCTHAIASDEVMIISDATLDDRFANHPSVTGEPHIRFYAGAPLIAPGGARLGTLCILDKQPRELDAAGRESLRDLAALVMDELLLRRTTADLQEEQKRFENAFLFSPIGLALVRPDGSWLRVNRAFCQIVGYSSEELLATNFQAITHPDDLDADVEFMRQMLAGEIANYRMEKRYIRKDGEVVWTELNASIVRSENGQPLYNIAQIKNITEQRQNEERLRLLESIVVNANDAILVTEAEPIDLPGPRILYANEAFLRGSGYSLEEVIGKTPRILQSPKTPREPLDKIRAALKKWQPVEVEILNCRKDGSEYGVELSIVPVANEKGWYTHWVSIQRDVTERRKNEAAFRESEARKTAIVENSLDAIVTMNADGEVVEWNRAAEQIFGYARDEVVGQDMAELIVPPGLREAHRSSRERYLQTGEKGILNQRIEVPGLRKDGQEIAVELVVVRLPTEGETLFAGFMRDLTDQKRAESDLLAAKEEAERANNAKSEFLSRISHELRTPLNAILGFSQIIQMEEEAGPLRETVDDIYDAGKHLLALINEVLDISRIESGQLALSREPVSVAEVMDEALALIAPLASQRQLTIETAEVLESKAFVFADRQRLVQCLINLLANAVKYNRDGGRIEIACRAVGETGWHISIEDTGNGIDADQMERLWTPFDRLGAERGNVEGTGLGLALTKRLIEQMDGELGVESTPSVGSTFWIELPAAESDVFSMSEEIGAGKNEFENEARSTVLLIEDNPRNIHVIERILAQRPLVSLLTATHGRVGLELAQGRRPDLILLDLHLPDIGGAAVLSQLQADDATKNIPVVIISADATSGQIERLKKAGAREYITKPLDVPLFLSLMDEILKDKISSQNLGETTQSRETAT